MAKIQEYDLEIHPKRIIKGQGLAEMLIEKNEAIQEGENERVCATTVKLENDEWYYDIIYYLHNLTTPPRLVDHKRRAVRLEIVKYCLIQEGLSWMSPNGVILQCVSKDESQNLIKKFHVGFCQGHYVARTIVHKIILRAGYY